MPELVYDGFTNLSMGMDAQRDPFILPEMQCARGLNVTFRGGLVKTRPGFVMDLVNLPKGTEFQGAGVWKLTSGDIIVFVQAGMVYLLRLTSLKLVRYGLRTQFGTQCCFIQADKYFIIIDGQRLPVVLEERDGVIKRRPYANTELNPAATPTVWYQSLPRASIGVFAHGRLHMVPYKIPTTDETGASSLLSGDIMEPLYPHKVLRYTETEYLSEGGAHALPFQMGTIGALGVIRNAASGTGTGHVLALATDGVCAFDFSIPRNQWKEQPLSQVLFFGCGCASPWSVVNLNDDLMYRSQDGIRSIQYTRAQAAGGAGALSNVPLSNEVEPFLTNDTNYLSRVSSAVWDNRVAMTCLGWSNLQDIGFYGFTVFDTAASYYNGVQGRGIYDGLWTGLNVAQVLTARKNGLGKPTLYLLTNDMALFHADPDALWDTVPAPSGYDPAVFTQNASIVSRIETRTMPFGDLGTTKQLRWLELWVKDVAITTEIKVWYRPSGYPLWTRLGDTRTISVGNSTTGGYPHVRRRLRFVLEEADCACDAPSGEPLWVGTGFQFAIEWAGNLTLERCRAGALPVAEAPPKPCDEAAEVIELGACAGELLSDTSYEAEFTYQHGTGVEGGVWDLAGTDADPADPEDTPPPDPDEEPGFPEQDPIPDPPLPPVNPGGGDVDDDGDGSGSGSGGGGSGYVPPEPPEPPEPEPGDPPHVRTGGVSNRTITSATISGSIAGMNETYSTATVYFKYRKSGDSAWTPSATGSINSTSTIAENFITNLTGLTADTSYQYQAWASVPGLDSELSGAVLGFRTLADPSLQTFSVLTLSADHIGPSAARLKGTLSAFPAEGVYADLKIYFKYKKTTDTSYIKTADITLSALSSFSQAITGLDPETEYMFSAWGEYGGQAVNGGGKYFTTLAVGADLPVVETIMAVPTAEVGVFWLTAAVVSLGTEVSVEPFMQIREVGTDTWADDIAIDETISTVPTSFSTDSEPLDAEKDYEFRGGVEWVDPAGTTRRAFGEIIPITGVLVETGPATPSVDYTSAQLTGQLSEMGDLDSGVLFFEYRIAAAQENEWTSEDVAIVWNTLEVPHLFYKTINGLDNTVGVEYEYRAGIRYDTSTQTGLTVVGEIATIPTAFAVLTVGATAAERQMSVTGNITAMGDYAGLAVSRFVEYRVAPPIEGPPEAWTRVAITGTQSAVGTFSLTITGLSPTANTTYEYRVGCAYGGADIGFGNIMSVEVPMAFPATLYGSFEGYWGYWSIRQVTLSRLDATQYAGYIDAALHTIKYVNGSWIFNGNFVSSPGQYVDFAAKSGSNPIGTYTILNSYFRNVKVSATP